MKHTQANTPIQVEFPCEVLLCSPYNGHFKGKLTGKKDGYKYEVELSTGVQIYLYEDDFVIAEDNICE